MIGGVRLGSMENPVERRVSGLADFSPVRLLRIHLCSVTQLASGEILCNGSNPMFNVISRKAQRLTVLGDSPQRDMDVRVFGITMHGCDPLQLRSEINFHLRHQPTRKPAEVETVAKLGRNDQLEKPRIVGSLPRAEGRSQIAICGVAVEA